MNELAREMGSEAKSTRTLYLLKEEQINFYWEKISEELRRTTLYEYWTEQQLLQAVQQGAMQCWALSDGTIKLILLSDIVRYSSGLRCLRFVGCVGEELDEFLPTIASCFRKVVKQLECHRIEVVGRRGWERKLRPLGFKHSFSVYQLEVSAPTEN